MSFDTPFSQMRGPIIPLKKEVSLQCHDESPLPSPSQTRDQSRLFFANARPCHPSQAYRSMTKAIEQMVYLWETDYMQDKCNIKKSDLQAQQVFSGPLVHTFSIDSASEIFG